MSDPDEPLDRSLREKLFPFLDAGWIVYEDDALIAIDKPAGVPAQEARDGAEDDLPARLAQYLRARDGGAALPYLGVHQRLDKETSGVVVYTRSVAANPGLARQLEARSVDKTYVAAVARWPHGGTTTLRDLLAPAPDGRARVASPSDPRAKLAITHVRPLARGEGGRALVEARIETGRTHQIRVQLAHAGAPIAGDALYGGPPAPRTMLHAARVALEHPITGARLVIESPGPPEMGDWVAGRDARALEDPEALRRTLQRALGRRFALGRSALRAPDARTTALRWVNEAGDGAPGIAVDLYADWALLHLYGEEAEAREGAIADALDALGVAGVYVKRRPRQANVLGAEGATALAPSTPIRGRAAPGELVVREAGMRFVVRLGDGMSTGLFLDQRANRARVRAMAGGLRVLNLFAYTCGFSVAAAAGGAARTVSVDSSAGALERGRANLALVAGRAEGQDVTLRADVFEWLERAGRRGERFDLVCCDPPTYSTTKKKRWSSGKQWRALAASCLRVLAPGGALLATSNDRRMTQGALRAELRAGADAAEVALASLRDLPAPEDFPAAIGEEPHLKGVVARLA